MRSAPEAEEVAETTAPILARARRVLRPRTAEEVVEVLAGARADGLGVVLLGGGGAPPPLAPERPFVALSTAALSGIDLYEPGDLTFTAGAGTTLGALEDRLGREGQWLPLDPAGGRARTLGGVVASGLGGPLQAGFGAIRDQVLGLTVVTGDGRILRLGGRVMKNVAGFDLVRLFVGSAGRLGVVVSASLRVFPRPRAQRILLLEGAGDGRQREGLPYAARAVATAPVVPSEAVLLRRPAGEVLVVRLTGSEPVLDAEQARLEEAVGRPFQTAADPEGWVERMAGRIGEGEGLGARHHGLPASLPERWTAWVAAAPTATLHADVLGGTLRARLPADAVDETVPHRWRGLAREDSAPVLFDSVPAGREALLERQGWGTARRGAGAGGAEGAAALERRLREAFDPHGSLAPMEYAR